MKSVQGWQKKKIYAIANALGYVDSKDKENDVLHMIVYAQTGKESVKDLTHNEAELIIAYLEQKQSHMSVESMSQGQKKKIWALMYRLKELDEIEDTTPVGERLAGIIKRQFDVKSTPQRLFTYLDREDGNKLIEILKHYIESAESRRPAGHMMN